MASSMQHAAQARAAEGLRVAKVEPRSREHTRDRADASPPFEFAALPVHPLGVLRRKCAACAAGRDDEVLRRDPLPGTSAAAHSGTSSLVAYLGASAGGGRPLEPGLRTSFEQGFGQPLDRVRVIADDGSARAASWLGARAFTLGSSIWFGRGEYQPDTSAGRRLLAHEVAHTVQQSVTGPDIQREIEIGSTDDPAEAAADRAADAVMRGEHASLGARGTSVLRRACSATPGPRPDQQIVSGCPNDSTTYTVTAQRQSGTSGNDGISATPGADFTNVWLDVEICANGTQVRLRPRVNATELGLRVLQNVVTGQPALGGVTIQGSMDVRVLPRSQTQPVDIRVEGRGNPRSGGWGIGASGSVAVGPFEIGPWVDYSRGAPGSGDPQDQLLGGVRVSERRPPPTNPCRVGTPERVTFTCQRPTTIPGRPATPAVLRSPTASIFVLFQYNSTQIVGWRFPNDPTVIPPGDARIRERVMELILMGGFRPASVTGFTSPEGTRHRVPGVFEGNDSLSQRRAQTAHDTFFAGPCLACPTQSGQALVPVGLSELYSPPDVDGREPRGDAALARPAVESFLAVDPLAPSDQVAFRRQSFDRQREQTYAMLRRAEIRLERNPVLVPADPGTPARPGPPEPVSCPEPVIRAARGSFGLPL